MRYRIEYIFKGNNEFLGIYEKEKIAPEELKEAINSIEKSDIPVESVTTKSGFIVTPVE